MKQAKKYALRLAGFILFLTGAVVLIEEISGKGEISVIVSFGLIGICLLIGLFFLWMRSDNDVSITGSLFDNVDEPAKVRSSKPVKRPEER